MALDLAITSGIRNEPPISTSSPRETITSPPSARVLRAISTAAALLFTTMVEISDDSRRVDYTTQGISQGLLELVLNRSGQATDRNLQTVRIKNSCSDFLAHTGQHGSSRLGNRNVPLTSNECSDFGRAQ